MDEGFGRGSEREERAGWATVRITPPLRGPLESLVLDPGVRPAPGDGSGRPVPHPPLRSHAAPRGRRLPAGA